MKFSEKPDYKSAVFASVGGDLAEAREAYQRLLDEAESQDDTVAISFLMHSLANVEARDGNFALGHELHLRAIGQSPDVPLDLLFYAKGLAEHFNEADGNAASLAEEKLQQAEELIKSDKWNRRIDSISPESYAEQIVEIRDIIKAQPRA